MLIIIDKRLTRDEHIVTFAKSILSTIYNLKVSGALVIVQIINLWPTGAVAGLNRESRSRIDAAALQRMYVTDPRRFVYY